MDGKLLTIVLSLIGAVLIRILTVFLGVGDFIPVPIELLPEEQKELLSFSNSWGGNMNGNHHARTIWIEEGDQVILTISDAEWYFQDPVVKEYRIDRSVLKEIQDIFWENRMDLWEGKTFSDEFICDGETESYHFDFSEDSIYFSSQIFNEPYRSKLAQLDAVVKSAAEEGELLPGLVMEERSEEEEYEYCSVVEGEVVFQVTEYSEGWLHYRLKNGLDQDLEWKEDLKLTRVEDQTVMAEETDEYPMTVYAMYAEEETLKLQERLTSGHYLLVVGEYSAEFEIR